MLQFRPLDEVSARSILTWRYAEPYAIYNAEPASLDADVANLVGPTNHYYAVFDNEALVAYRCFGVDARVPGGAYVDDAVDTGGGMRPDLTGQGRGFEYLQAGLEHGRKLFGRVNFRVTCAEFNRRAQIVCERAGFTQVERFERPSDGMSFVVMVLRD